MTLLMFLAITVIIIIIIIGILAKPSFKGIKKPWREDPPDEPSLKKTDADAKGKSYYYAQVDLYLESGQIQRALYQATRNIAYNEEDPVAYINRARVYEKLGRVEKAILDLKEALRIAPDNEDALQRLSALERLSKPEHPIGDPHK